MYYNPTTPYLTSGDVLSTSIAFETWEPFIGTQYDNINRSQQQYENNAFLLFLGFITEIMNIFV
jgi:hypothetical protein